jgi:nicotinate-nucleotide adenylyltransferase
MKYGIYGGSFNPPHMCHVLTVALALSSGQVDKVLVIPCFSHAFDKKLLTFEHRFAMCRAAFQLFGERVIVSRLEEDMGGVSYTVDTLSRLRREMPEDSLRLVAGADIVPELAKWKQPEEVKRLAPLLIIGRDEYGEEGSSLFPWPLPNLSSTMLRDLLLTGSVQAGLLPSGVMEYINENKLYLES